MAVETLWKLHKDRFPAFLDALKSASTMEEALKESMGLDYAKLDSQTKAACNAEGA